MTVKLRDLDSGTMFRHDGKLYQRGEATTLMNKTIRCSPSVGGKVQTSASLVIELPADTMVFVDHD